MSEIIEKINLLKVNPKKYGVISDILIKKSEIRKINVKKYLIFYKIFEKEKEVQILRILHNKRNWKKIL